MTQTGVLALFHPAVRRWFSESFAAPTPPQVLGWPVIARGEHTLILAPTGSGKTLAAFLFAINDLFAHPDGRSRGVEILYLSPLKALAADIERNLRDPLAGIRCAGETLGQDLPEVTVGVRTGDTTSTERQRMVRRPPRILVTTPESLHLLLTAERSREGLRTVRTVIVDEIHALCGNKRGSFLSLLLERLERLTGRPFVRIGLSATQRPLDAVARFLGGIDAAGTPRPVRIVDAGMRKDMDLAVISPVEDMADLPREGSGPPSIWPAVYDRLLGLVEAHRSTLIFANNRRTVERIASELNRRVGYPLVRAHHGSVSKEKRAAIEADLKAGRIPALVATGSLELGIDMGAIDLVCQVESPHSVARGLQRVGRAGHLYRAASVGRLLPKTRDDLLEMAALSRAMRHGEISAVHVPRAPLDVLAQQLVAMVAVEELPVADAFALVRRAAPYQGLPEAVFRSVVGLVSGEYATPAAPHLRPHISWDRVHDRLYPLPGSRRVAVLNGGAIPDTGQYPVLVEEGGARLGELDEEFIYERRVGETILLGTGRWRITRIGIDRVLVAPSAEHEAQMPFWRGEGLGRDAEFGERVGAFLRSCKERLDRPGFEAWLRSECALDATAAWNLARYLEDQCKDGAEIPDDRTLLLDAFRNELGDPCLAVLSPYGRAFHLAFLLAALARWQEGGGPAPHAVHSDTGILFKLGDRSIEEAIGLLSSIGSRDVARLIMAQVEDSPLFGLRFRQGAGRALLLPRKRPGKRTPLWLQRLRGRDLLALARGYPSFPIVVEAYREVMEDDLPVRALQALLRAHEQGQVRFVVRRGRHPSPFAASLLFDFTAANFYEWDTPKPLPVGSRVDQETVAAFLGAQVPVHLFDASAVDVMEERLQGLTPTGRARDGTELVELLRRLGDLTPEELACRVQPEALAALPDLLADGRVAWATVDGVENPLRYVAAEDVARYQSGSFDDQAFLVGRYLAAHALVRPDELGARYGLSSERLGGILSGMNLVRTVRADGPAVVDPRVAEGIRRLTLAVRRGSARTVPPERFCGLLLDLEHVTRPLSGPDGLREVLTQLSWCALPLPAWERVLAARVRGYRHNHLEVLLQTGAFVWRGETAGKTVRRIVFTPRDDLPHFLQFFPPQEVPAEPLCAHVLEVLAARGASFLDEIARAADAPPSRVAEALWDLIWAGRVTNDSLAPIRAGRPAGALWQAGRRARGWAGGIGRFSVIPGVAAPDGSDDRALEALLVRLLARRGVVFRESFTDLPVSWGTVYPVLTRWEWQGRVERGLFVRSLSGSQFAAPQTLERLFAPPRGAGLVLLSTLDPANPYGPGGLFPLRDAAGRDLPLRRHVGNDLVLRGGVPILAVENRGARLTPLVDLDRAGRREALALLPELLRREPRVRRIRVQEWDGTPILTSPAHEDLEALGFMRDDLEMTYYQRYGASR